MIFEKAQQITQFHENLNNCRNSPTLISRKICLLDKFINFQTVCMRIYNNQVCKVKVRIKLKIRIIRTAADINIEFILPYENWHGLINPTVLRVV